MPDLPPQGTTSEQDSANLVAAEFGHLLHSVTPRVWLVFGIVAVNSAVFVLMVARGVSAFSPSAKDVLAWGANYGPRTLQGEPWRLLVSLFLHFGALHLAMNMVALWSAGLLVERVFGQARFAAVYLVAGLCGSIASLAVHPQVISAGASGAVFGVYGALGAFLLRQRGAIPSPVLTKLSKVAFGFIAFNIAYGFVQPNIDAAAHIGGLLGGATAGAWLARPLVPGRTESLTRPLFVTALALGIAVATVAVLPRPVDVAVVLERFSSDEKALIATYNELVTKLRKKELTESQFAGAMQSTVIDPWREARARLGGSQRWPPRQRKLADLLIRYSTAREAVWSSWVNGIRLNDLKFFEEMMAHEAEATHLLDELNHLKQ